MSHPANDQWNDHQVENENDLVIEAQCKQYADKLSKMDDEELLDEWVSYRPDERNTVEDFNDAMYNKGRSWVEWNLLDSFSDKLNH